MMSTPVDELRKKFSDRYMKINRYQECMMAPLPHFLPAEQLIFCEWVHEYEQWGEYFFDLPLYPDLRHWEGRTEKEVLEAMKYMLALKVDAVKIESSDEVSIIEVKRRGLASGVGQLLVYRERFIAQFPELRVRDMIYVTTLMSKEIEAAAKNQGIKVYVLPWLGYLGVRYSLGGG
jgi:hypothetical protein